MSDQSARIPSLFSKLEQELALLQLSFDYPPSEHPFLQAHQQLLHTCWSIQQLASDQPAELSFLDPDPPNQLWSERKTTSKDLRDALLQELAQVLHNLRTPATIQGAIDRYRDGLTKYGSCFGNATTSTVLSKYTGQAIFQGFILLTHE